MKKNMGGTDRMIRIILVLVIASLYYFKVVEGTLAIVLLAVAVIFLFTSIINFCPLYSLFGIKTCKIKK